MGDVIAQSIEIDAPPERVFRHLADVTTHPGWANPKAAMRMEQIAGDGPGTDSAYRSSGVFVGKAVTADISVTAYEPSRRFAIRSDQHQEGKRDVWYVNDYTLDYGETGRASIREFLGHAHAAGLIPAPVELEFVD